MGLITTHVHYVVEDDKCSSLCLRFVSKTDLTNATIPPKQLVEIVAGHLVVEIFDKQDPVRAWRQLCLQSLGSDKYFNQT